MQVINVAPTATLSAGRHLATMASSGQEVWAIQGGELVQLEVEEPSWEDWYQLTYNWTIDGGEPFAGPAALSLPDYTPGRVYEITVSVSDKDGGQSEEFAFKVVVFAALGTEESPGGFSPYGLPGTGAVYGALLPTGADPPAGYNRFAYLPTYTESGVGAGFSASFQLDEASTAFVASSGSTVQYHFMVEVWNIQPGYFGSSNVLLSREWSTNTTGDAPIPEYEPLDRKIVVMVNAELIKDGQQFRLSAPYKLVVTTAQSQTIVQQFTAMAQMLANLFSQVGPKANDLLEAFKTNSVGILEALTEGVTGAFQEYFASWQTHLLPTVLTWLGVGTLPSLPPGGLTLEGVVPYLLNFAGLTWDKVQNYALKELGEGNVAAVKRLAEQVFSAEPDFSNLDSLKQFLQTAGLPNVGGLVTQARDALVNKMTTLVTEMVPQLLARFVPGPGTLYAAYQAIQRGLSWMMENGQQMQALFAKLVEAVDHLITPSALGVKNAILGALTGPNGAAIVSFVANQLGLGRLPQQLKSALAFIPTEVEKAIRSKVRSLAMGLNGSLNPVYNGRLAKEQTFDHLDGSYALVAVRDSQGVKAKLVNQTGLVHRLVKVLEAKDFTTTQARDRFNAYLGRARDLAGAAKGKPRNRTPNQAQSNLFPQLGEIQTQMLAAGILVINDLKSDACQVLLDGCFAAGTKLLTRSGWKPVEEIGVGDELASRPERDPDGPVEWKPVERVFVRTGRILHLHLADGALIRTTPEHPFWVEGEGWTQAGLLRPGDRLVTRDGEGAVVEEAYDTGEYERVYNCRVADHHTYFVGDEGWVAAVWAHNAACKFYIAEEYTQAGTQLGYTVFKKADGQRVQNTHYTTFADALAAVKTDAAWDAVRKGRYHSVELGPGFGWNTVLDRHGTDLLLASKPTPLSYTMPYKTTDSDPNNKVYTGHAHHIVMEHGPSTSRTVVRQSQAVLRKHKIDPYFSRENFAWAPNYYHATDAYANAVWTALSGANSRKKALERLDDIAPIHPGRVGHSHKGAVTDRNGHESVCAWRGIHGG